jgi:hypothetical protein
MPSTPFSCFILTISHVVTSSLFGFKSLTLGLLAVLSPLTSGLGLGALGVHLLLDDALTLLLGLGLVDLSSC